MTREERIEAATAIVDIFRDVVDGDDLVADADLAKMALEAAFPEYFANTHVFLPREPTEETLAAMDWMAQWVSPTAVYEQIVELA